MLKVSTARSQRADAQDEACKACLQTDKLWNQKRSMNTERLWLELRSAMLKRAGMDKNESRKNHEMAEKSGDLNVTGGAACFPTAQSHHRYPQVVHRTLKLATP